MSEVLGPGGGCSGPCALRLQVWLQYQCLWDMQAENIYNRLGEDLNKWQALLVQIRKARGTFDNAETKKEFGPVVIDYGKVCGACSQAVGCG